MIDRINKIPWWAMIAFGVLLGVAIGLTLRLPERVHAAPAPSALSAWQAENYPAQLAQVLTEIVAVEIGGGGRVIFMIDADGNVRDIKIVSPGRAAILVTLEIEGRPTFAALTDGRDAKHDVRALALERDTFPAWEVRHQ